MRRLLAIAAVCLALGTGSSLLADSTFNFDSDTVGAKTPLSNTDNGVTATFTSLGSGYFEIGISNFQTLSGNVLVSSILPENVNQDMQIAFSTTGSAVSMLFALNTSNELTTFDLAAYLNGTLVGTSSAVGTNSPGPYQYPEGSISYSGVFDTLILSTAAPNLAIDNVVFTPTGVPEPATFLLVGTGLAAVLRRKLRR